ncbi:menaquinone via futalosine step 1 [Sulfurospirillum sp. T05]|uniref:Chorismate dehydratase n=1 Tax=Sulfurospirillum tamanense TaxID=2813362 RepID=A0ABS2WUS4_9BACT|nr:menaquinone via futalosine step 1 [Sulfurospirillum tamanensis]
MIFGKIDYINLLPFHVFLKRSALSNAFKQSLEYKKGVPSVLNHKLKRRQIDAAVISSITSTHPMYHRLDMGIVAKKEVKSVLVKRGKCTLDPASASSNALANVLHVKGEVLIGDRALKAYLQDPSAYVDLAKTWNARTGLPFVFARLCVTKDTAFYRRLAARFVNQNVRIPRYILNQYAKERGISEKDILDYLTLISYRIETKEKRALKRFLGLVKK